MTQDSNRQTDGSDLIVPNDSASTAFVKGIVARGEAARRDPNAPLPPGVTHEIVGETANGLPILKRKRFSAF